MWRGYISHAHVKAFVVNGLFHTTRDGLSVSSKSIKIEGKKMDKVRRIVHLILRPLHFQIKTHYPSDANYPTEFASQTNNPSLVWIGPMPRSFGSGNCSLCLFATSRLRRRAMKIKLHVINETSHHTTYTSFNDFFFKSAYSSRER